jgi:hypothetical protein
MDVDYQNIFIEKN